MSFEMIHGDQRLVEGEGQCFGGPDPDQQAPAPCPCMTASASIDW